MSKGEITDTLKLNVFLQFLQVYHRRGKLKNKMSYCETPQCVQELNEFDCGVLTSFLWNRLSERMNHIQTDGFPTSSVNVDKNRQNNKPKNAQTRHLIICHCSFFAPDNSLWCQ